MKKLVSCLLLIVSIEASFAQSAIADLQFEDAEKAFVNNEFETVLAKLDDFEKTYGSVTAKSLYLRIISQDKLVFANENLDDASTIALLASLRKNAAAYLKAMEKEGLDDKFRETYQISEKLKKMDDTQWLAEKKQQQKRLALFKNFTDSVSALYKYRPGITKQEFLDAHAEFNSYKIKSDFVAQTNQYNPFGFAYNAYFRDIDYAKTKGNDYLGGFSGYIASLNNEVINCSWYLEDSKSSLQQHQEAFEKLRNTITSLLPQDAFYEKSDKRYLPKTRLIIPVKNNNGDVAYYIIYGIIAGESAHNVFVAFSTKKELAEY